MAAAPWVCEKCTYRHEGAEASRATCSICGADRGAVPATAAAAATAAPSAPSAAAAAPTAPAPEAQPLPEVPAKCMWLASQGVENEQKALELEAAGNAKEAAFHHRLAASKFSEAAELCPDGHPDRPKLSDHSLDLSTRTVYLESLGGARITVPLEDHVGELRLSMELSAAPPCPTEQAVPALLARAGTSGASAPLSEEGFQLVHSLQSLAEMKAFVDRIVASDGRKRKGDVADADIEATLSGVDSFAGLQDRLRRASWVDLEIDPNMDKLDLAVKLEAEARSLEAQGRADEAKQMFVRAHAIFQYLLKYDPRCKGEKIKEMVGKRLEDMAAKIAA